MNAVILLVKVFAIVRWLAVAGSEGEVSSFVAAIPDTLSSLQASFTRPQSSMPDNRQSHSTSNERYNHPSTQTANTIDIGRKVGDAFDSFEIEFNGIPAREFVPFDKTSVTRVVDSYEVLWEAKSPGDYCPRIVVYQHLYTPDLVALRRVESKRFDMLFFRRKCDKWVKVEEDEFLSRLDEDQLIEFVMNVDHPSAEFVDAVSSYIHGAYAKIMRPLVGFKAVALSGEKGVWFQVPKTGFSTVIRFSRYPFMDLIYVCAYGREYQLYHYFFQESDKGWKSMDADKFNEALAEMIKGRPADPDGFGVPSILMGVVAILCLVYL
ncbi:hypothetical protein BEWA_049970 [Theileria equi strain WA]|uniref:Signal peptide-containing protein n=1 Tax=Theileria equi strain WA TaxID=1537102 RepID=L1LB82_THEEQ|nr:hypothetical protein BEWA_049970 [Theileria equi strain WA]EKX72529.1 hypothetical protein BEWA_049970 [Theileria equi strain WA]|eukprot:XP_004831981.1 hypothetical protein BEWA_049970 [Theileria equi strain WA]